tara:strand:+ start:4441 stop:4773 length:333 start_codon:yes stop_codon:yes gene_type:complete
MWTRVYSIDNNFKHPEKWPNKEYKYNDIKLWKPYKSINNLSKLKIINNSSNEDKFYYYYNLNYIQNIYKNKNLINKPKNLLVIENKYYDYISNRVSNLKHYIKYMIYMIL